MMIKIDGGKSRYTVPLISDEYEEEIVQVYSAT
jgi:hypothetical protein